VARIERFTSRAEADVACGLLRAHGLRAYVSADDAGGARPDFPFSIGGTAVVVADEDLDVALALLEDVTGSDEPGGADDGAGAG
jgi:hypothetical protein